MDKIYADDSYIAINIDYKWKDAFHHKAVSVKLGESGSLGFKILWYLYSADIWFGNFPLLKALVACNIAVWIILFLTR